MPVCFHAFLMHVFISSIPFVIYSEKSFDVCFLICSKDRMDQMGGNAFEQEPFRWNDNRM